MSPRHVNPMQWHQAVGYARQSCARFFRDGCTPIDAMRAFDVCHDERTANDWGKAVELIAEVLCAQTTKRAA